MPELLSWLISLKGLLSLCAIANVTAMDGKQTHLIFWGNTKRQLALTGATALNAATAQTATLYIHGFIGMFLILSRP